MFHATEKNGIFVNSEGFIINFRPLISAHNLSGDFVIEHWNKPDKLWGYYDSFTNKYFLIGVEQLSQPFYKEGTRISIEYSESIKPTDAILFTDTIIKIVNGNLTLEAVNQDVRLDNE